jgi:paraquat-inducible protein A
MYPHAALVFFTSIAVPLLKLVGLSTMLMATQPRRSSWLCERTRPYHVVRWVGRWSMIDVFMESLLGRWSSSATSSPSNRESVQFAAETFVPMLMWDAARVSPA